MEKPKIGMRLERIRKENHLSQQELGDKIGLSQKTISSWEKDRTYPKMKELNALCKIYDCTLQHLTGTKQYDSNDITIEDIMFKLNTLDEDTLLKINDHIEYLLSHRKEIEKMEEEKAYLEQQIEAYKKKINAHLF